MADDEIRRLERTPSGGDPHARRRLRRKRHELAPDDVTPLLQDLYLDAWNALDEEERDEVAALLARVVSTRRHLQLVSMSRYGPDADQPIARYRDPATDLVYALIPGGRFRPGLTDAQRTRLHYLFENEADGPPELDYLPRSGEEVEVQPLLMAIAPVPVGCAALPEALRSGGGLGRILQERSGPGSFHVTCYVARKELDRALACLGAVGLAGARELEWAARGGMNTIFPWGNDLAFFEAAERAGDWSSAPAIDCSIPTRQLETTEWPAVNRFGLVSLGGPTMWCLDEAGELSTWSGAGENWPWQEADRSQVSINGFVPPLWQLEGAVRPVIHLVAGSSPLARTAPTR